MPISKNQLDRLMFIDEKLASSEGVTTTEIHDRFQSVSLRTIQLDINFLKEEFGREIYRSGKRLHYKDKSNPLFNQGLSKEEKSILVELIGSLGSMGDIFPNLSDLQQRLSDGVRTPSDKNILLFHSNPDYVGIPLISTLYKYIHDRRLIVVRYQKFNDAKPKDYIISPYLLKEYDSRWYLVGKNMNPAEDKADDPYYSLPLDRICDVSENVPKGYRYESEPDDFRDRYDSVIGVSFYKDRPEQDIVIAVDPDEQKNIIKFIDTKPLCGSQIILRGPELERNRMRWPQFKDWHFCVLKGMRMSNELVQTLIRYYGYMVVVSPEDVSKEIYGMTKKLLDMYESLNME